MVSTPLIVENHTEEIKNNWDGNETPDWSRINILHAAIHNVYIGKLLGTPYMASIESFDSFAKLSVRIECGTSSLMFVPVEISVSLNQNDKAWFEMSSFCFIFYLPSLFQVFCFKRHFLLLYIIYLFIYLFICFKLKFITHFFAWINWLIFISPFNALQYLLIVILTMHLYTRSYILINYVQFHYIVSTMYRRAWLDLMSHKLLSRKKHTHTSTSRLGHFSSKSTGSTGVMSVHEDESLIAGL